jgi:hypothetical protein
MESSAGNTARSALTVGAPERADFRFQGGRSGTEARQTAAYSWIISLAADRPSEKDFTFVTRQEAVQLVELGQ